MRREQIGIQKIRTNPKICIGEYGNEYKLRREEKGNENRL